MLERPPNRASSTVKGDLECYTRSMSGRLNKRTVLRASFNSVFKSRLCLALYFSLALSTLLFSTLLFSTLAFAQQNPEAARLLGEARKVVAEAEAQYAGTVLNIDQPLFRRAINLGEQALAADPNDPETALFLARTYSRIGWFIRAWPRWQGYLSTGGALTPDDADKFAATGTELGFARYSVGDLSGALPYYRTVAEVLPDDPRSPELAGAHFVGAGRPGGGAALLGAPGEPGPEQRRFYVLPRPHQRANTGRSGGERGVSQRFERLRRGRLSGGASRLQDRRAANPRFTEALTWAARTSGELERFDEATALWQRVLELAPDDPGAKYFLGLIRDQKQWGAAAASAFYEGQKLYQEDDLAGAAERFDAASRFNPAFKDALVWTARSLQELGQADEALAAWRKVLKLDPEDKRATYFLNLAEQQFAYGSEAGRAFVQGVEQFEVSNLTEAESLFHEAVQTNPNFAEAWAWLGRTRFTSADYAAAAVALPQSRRVEPDNDDYRFFADEAAFLSGDE